MSDVMVEPTIREEEDHFVLPLTGREVDQVCVDYAVTLVIDGTDTVRLDSPFTAVSYTHLRAHETVLDIVCRLLLEKKKTRLNQTTPQIKQTRQSHNVNARRTHT